MTDIIVTGSAEDIRDFLFGPQQHNAHVREHKWHQYLAQINPKEKMADVQRAARQIIAEQNARRAEYQIAAE